MLKHSIIQTQSQRLSPQQIQLMKILQIPTATLDQRIKEELEVNPALEEGDNDYEEDLFGSNLPEESFFEKQKEKEDTSSSTSEEFEMEGSAGEDHGLDEVISFDDYMNSYMEDDDASYKYKSDGYGGDEEEKTVPIIFENSFHEHLEQQLGLLRLENETQEKIAKQIIGSIDEDGYLRREPRIIVDDMLLLHNIPTTIEEVNGLLAKIQKFDPSGVGAKDLQECLIIQLQNKLEIEDLDKESRYILRIALRIITDHFDEFSKKHYPKLQRQLGVTDEDLKDAVDAILKLNPKPASGHASSLDRSLNYIVPDFIISNREGELDLSLNSKNAPELRVSDQYRDMLKDFKHTSKVRKATRREKEAILFIKQKIDSAKWFIDAIRQRQDTMMRTMYAILRYQYEFFLTGDEKKLKPMILKDIADITGLDISTVSRVANSKYVQTEFGTKRLKDFFSESLQTDSGEEVSTLEVKKILTDIISAEDKRKPHSDEKLKNMLQKKGYNIARRTVAKYREQLNVPVARLRKTL